LTHLQIVNGYICFNCADVALAQKGENPAHPPGSPSNPTGNTPNGLYPLNGAAGVNAPSQSLNAVVFGGALSGLNGTSGAPASPPPYQTGAQVSVFA
jgi:hypothetical protein